MTGKGVFLGLPTNQALMKINFPAGTNWTGFTHLRMTVNLLGNSGVQPPQPLFMAVQSTGIWCFTEFMLAPGKDNTIIMPLDNSMLLGNFGLPQPPTNTAAQMFAGFTVDKPHVQWMMIEAPNQTTPITVLIKDLRPITASIPTTGIVDKYGQQAQVGWPGKIQSDSDLATNVAARQISGSYPYAADAYGGVSGTSQTGSNTGLWHTAKQNGKWYIIDPVGNRFFSAGVVGAGNSPPAIVTGHESAFVNGALPAQTDPLAIHYGTGTDGNGNPIQTYDFYSANVHRRLGTNWKSGLLTTTAARLKTWGMNTAGPTSNGDFRLPTSTTPFTEVILINGTFAKVFDQSSGAMMPDPYDAAFAPAARNSISYLTNIYRGNLMNVGLFIDNELPWAKTYALPNARYGLCEDILMSPATQPSKIAFVSFLTQRYASNIASFNAAWGTSFASFTSLLNGSTSLPDTLPAGMAQDMQDFTLAYARLYYTTVRQQLTALGYQGLYLGDRCLYYTPEVLQAAKESVDVISFNDYETVASSHHADMKALDAPVMISEVGFSACDLGRISIGMNILTEADRATYFNNYVSDAATWPNLVGLHWYKWQDDVVSGRYYDNENHSRGIVSIADIPYWPIVDSLTNANLQFHQRLLTP